MDDSIVRQSVFDRLIGADRIATGAGDQPRAPRSFQESVDLLKENLLRDLHSLLNTRRITEEPDPELEYLSQSIRYYGLEDLTGVWTTPEHLTHAIERTIELHEPRLTDVKVRVAESDRKGDRRVELLLEGTLKLDPDPEHVEFDTVLEITSGKFQLQTHDPDA